MYCIMTSTGPYLALRFRLVHYTVYTLPPRTPYWLRAEQTFEQNVIDHIHVCESDEYNNVCNYTYIFLFYSYIIIIIHHGGDMHVFTSFKCVVCCYLHYN